MVSPMAASKLFTPIKVGRVYLQHRVALAPLTRNRANAAHVHGDLALEYYSQRASTPGTLLITEGTFLSPEAGGYDHVPGIWSEEQIASWKRITDAVHSRGSFIVVQLWALGRAAKKEIIEEEGYEVVGPSNIPRIDGDIPRPLTKEEIADYVRKYAIAAKNAIAAGFDGVEVHGANGYLPDQFLQDVSNQRTDEYGGSIENRARFPLEILAAVVEAIGEDRTALRFSPWTRFGSMRMEEPIPTFRYITEQITTRFPNLMYLHFIESQDEDPATDDQAPPEGQTSRPATNNEFARKIWAPRPFISAGGYSDALAKISKAADERGVIVAMGRAFIANPDLPVRLRKGIPLNAYDPSSFYLRESPIGYTDPPFAAEN